jgi:hypothetical protein
MLFERIPRRPIVTLAAVALFCVVLPCQPVAAQEIFASLTGTVSASDGALLPGVTVTATNIDTNESTVAVSDSHGGYTISKLPPGRYRVTAALSGFTTYVRQGLVLKTAETARINLRLTPGALAEAITVSAAVSVVESNESTLAQTMDNKRVAELPLNGRQVYMLLQMTPGTIFTQTTFGATGFSGTRAWDVNGSVTIHGSRTGNNEFLIDGAATSGTGGWSYAPPVDAIEEFKVQSASTDASYGRTSGGVVNLTLKAGTNNFRFSNTVMYRGTSLDSKTIQNLNTGTTINGHKYYDAEGMFSGPVRRDKTFFMVGYQGFYENIPFPNTATVPTDLQRAGDFRGTLNGAGQQLTIYDPLTTRADPTKPGQLIRDPISCNGVINVICPERIDPVAKALLQSIPRANTAGTITGLNDLIASPNLGFYRYKSYLFRVDHAFNESNRLYFTNSGNWGNERRSENSLPPGPALRSDNWPTKRISHLATADDVLTLSPDLLLDTRISYDVFDEPHPKQFGPLGDIKLPFQTAYQVTADPWFPHLTFTSLYTELFGRPPRETKNQIYSGQSTLSKALGQHFVKAGIDLRNYRLTRFDLNEANGRYDFSGAFTRRDPQRADSTSGNPFASFLLGFPDGANTFVSINASSIRKYAYYGVFVQDDWRISPRLSVGAGLRWDYQPPVREANDHLVVGFDTSSPSPLKVAGYNLRGGLLYPHVNSNRTTPYKGDYNNFQPRINAAYQLTSRVAARASAGRSYFALSGGGGNGSVIESLIQNGYSQSTFMVTSVQTGIPFNTLSKPYPEGFLQPDNGAKGLATGIGTGISFMNPNFEVPYADQWMAGFNIELPWDTGLNLAYVGNKTYKLPTQSGTAINEISMADRLKGIADPTYLSTTVPNPFAGLVPGTALNTPSIARSQLLRPYPQFQGITETLDNNGWSRYKAFEMAANKRFSGELAATLSYTWSRQLDAINYLNNGFDTKPFEDLSSIDRTHHVAVTALYNLPFGPGRPIGGSAAGWVANVIGGWQFNVLYEWESGTPVAMPNGILRQSSAKISNRMRDQWFDNSTKSNPRPDGTYAWDTLPPNAFRVARFRMPDVREPSILNTGVSLFKNTPTGMGTLQLRFELFNPLNKRIYGGPTTTITDPNFGKISQVQINFPRQGQVGVRYVF